MRIADLVGQKAADLDLDARATRKPAVELEDADRTDNDSRVGLLAADRLVPPRHGESPAPPLSGPRAAGESLEPRRALPRPVEGLRKGLALLEVDRRSGARGRGPDQRERQGGDRQLPARDPQAAREAAQPGHGAQHG